MTSTVLAVAAGGAIGAAARHLVNLMALRLLGPGFPWGTLTVNVFGSFLMGVLIAVLVARDPNPNMLRSFLATGVLGGFTTFSAFSLDAVLLFERGQPLAAMAYVLTSVLVSIAALFAALWLGRSLL